MISFLKKIVAIPQASLEKSTWMLYEKLHIVWVGTGFFFIIVISNIGIKEYYEKKGDKFFFKGHRTTTKDFRVY